MSKLDVLTLSELTFVSPDCLVTKDGTNLVISKKSLKFLMKLLGLVGDKFSKDLFDIDEAVWSKLVEEKCRYSLEYRSNSAIVANGEIINIVSNDNRDWLVVLEDFLKNQPSEQFSEYKILRDEEGFSVLCEASDGRGFVISINIPDKTITSQGIRKLNNGIIYIAPLDTVNCKIDSGVNSSDLKIILNFESLISEEDNTAALDFSEAVDRCRLSCAEALDVLKTVYGVKVKFSIPGPELYLPKIDASQFSFDEVSFAGRLLTEIYHYAYHYIPAKKWLEKSIRFIDTTYSELLKVLSARFEEGNLEYAVLKRFCDKATASDLDDLIVSRVFPRE